eukprot:PITA_32761
MSSSFKENEKLGDSSNFAARKVRLEIIVDNNDVMGYIQGKVSEPPENASVAAKNKHKKGELKAKQIIVDALQDNLLAYVGNLRRSTDMSDKIVGMYEVKILNEIISLKDQLKDTTMNKGEFVQSYITRISRLRDQLQRVGEIVFDMELVIITLRGLPPIWETFINTISNNIVLPSFDEIVGKLTQEESRMISRGRIQKHEEGEPAKFVTQNKKKKGKGGRSRNPPPRDTKRRNDRTSAHIECYNCHHKVHYARDCLEKHNGPRYNTRSNNRFDDQRRRDDRRNDRNGRDERRRRDAPSDHEEDRRPQQKSRYSRYESNVGKQFEYILISVLTSSSPPDSWDSWLVDSGATHQFFGYKEVLSNLVERELNLKIILGDNSTHPVKGFGSVKFHLNSGDSILLHNVILAHLHYDALPKLEKLVSRIPKVQAQHDRVSPGCANGKKTRGPFPSNENKTNDILHLIHSDLGGPMLIQSLGGNLYYVTFIDDFSRKMWVYYLKHKHETFEIFKEFKVLIENQTRKKIKIFKSDNGGEYTSNEFIDLCKKESMKKETTMPCTPEQNIVVEMKNRFIVESACVMLHDQKLSKFLWREATNVSIYVQNRVPHQALDNKTPEEVFISVKPDVSHLHISGYPVYFHVPKDKRNKL